VAVEWAGHEVSYQWTIITMFWAEPGLVMVCPAHGLGWPCACLAIFCAGHGLVCLWAGLFMGCANHGLA
jgi:hypothetical protein